MKIFSCTTNVKCGIINRLDEADSPMTLEELLAAPDIDHSVKGQQLLAICQELAQEIQQIYPKDMVQFSAHPQHLFLVRNSSNLQYIKEFLMTHDLTYEILVTLCTKISVNTENFCHQHGVSFSTLRRRNLKLNETLVPFRLHITTSQQLRLNGSQLDFAYFAFLLLFSVHGDIDRVTDQTEQSKLISISRLVMKKLALPYDENQHRLLALLLYTVKCSSHFKPTITDVESDLLTGYRFPPKPKELLRWSTADWRRLLILFHALPLFDYQLPLDHGALPPLIKEFTQNWLAGFEANFLRFGAHTEKISLSQLSQQLIQAALLPTDEQTTEDLIFFSLAEFQLIYPYYHQQFENFWQTLLEQAPFLAQAETFFKITNLLLCIRLCPIPNVLPPIKIYISSNLGELYTNYLKNRLGGQLRLSAFPIFIDAADEAEVILSLLPSARVPLKSGQRLIIVRLPLHKKDLTHIYTTVKAVLEQRD